MYFSGSCIVAAAAIELSLKLSSLVPRRIEYHAYESRQPITLDRLDAHWSVDSIVARSHGNHSKQGCDVDGRWYAAPQRGIELIA